MGSAFSDWAQFEGPLYMGANTSWEVIWTLVAVAMCIVALVVGSRHELDAYKKMKEGKEVDEGPL